MLKIQSGYPGIHATKPIDSRFAIHKVMLFDSYNHIIYETNVDASQKSISIPSNIASGLYFVQICTKKGSIISKKLMVNK